MRLAIMQPYLFPYIGYFQLIHSVDQFIFYDDVQFIERGWIHRNRLMVNGKAKYITIPCRSGSKYLMINEVEHVLNRGNREKILNQVSQYYLKAPFFEEVYPLVESVLKNESNKLVDIAIQSVKVTSEYLGLNTPLSISSKITDNMRLGRVERLVDICKQTGADIYINAQGGEKLYSKKTFQEHGIDLLFLKPEKIIYSQFDYDFLPWLSIIDVMMFNSRKRIDLFLKKYELN